MNPTVRNIIAIIVGIAVALIINMSLIMLGPLLITNPEGFNPDNLETFSLLQPIHLITPFLAHALGSLFGAFIASLISQTKKMRVALIVGAIHMIGGIVMAVQTDVVIWYDVLDITLAYLPMAVLGVALGKAFSR